VIHGLCGRPWVDLEPHLDLSALADVHEEVCVGLAQVPVAYTGGSHRSMGIMPAGREHEALVDYGEVIAAMTPELYDTFRSLADDPASYPDSPRGASFGEERDHDLNETQMLWLQYRFGVYYPWKVFFEMIPNRWWGEKSTAAGKQFTRLARAYFPKTIAFVETLPFVSIGRCNIMGLAPNDHGTLHRDGVPEEKREVDHFITIAPGGNKRLYLWDQEKDAKTIVKGRAYWFNDSDWHGVLADPFFRYSLRVDGVFRPDFLARIGG
jgi:hypothetical protein